MTRCQDHLYNYYVSSLSNIIFLCISDGNKGRGAITMFQKVFSKD